MSNPYINIHPGEFVKEELEVRGHVDTMSKTLWLVTRSGLSTEYWQGVLACRNNLVGEAMRELSEFFGQSQAYWENLQSNYNRRVDSPAGYISQAAKDKITRWLATSDNTGISSEAIAFAMLGQEYTKWSHTTPCDGADFNRCRLLLDEIPELRSKLHIMRLQSRKWAALVDRWDEIEKTLLREMAAGATAEETYKMIQECNDA